MGKDASSKQPDFLESLIIKPPSSQQDRGCALLGLTIYLMCCGLTGCPQVSSWCLHNHICASCFLAGKKDWFNAWFCLKSRIWACSPVRSFPNWFFHFLDQWTQLISWIIQVLSGRINWVSAIWEKNKRWHFMLSKRSASNLLIFSMSLGIGGNWAWFEKEDLYREDLITWIGAIWKAWCIFNNFILTVVGRKLEAMATLYVLCILIFISLSHVPSVSCLVVATMYRRS